MITNSTRQRQLRGHMPRRPSPRAACSAEHQARLATRLTPRDRWLAWMLWEHRVLTSHQITELAWPTLRAANHRLQRLHAWSVLDRFQPFVTSGSAPHHYVLGPAGATVVAHQHGLDPKTLGYQRRQVLGISSSLTLTHLLGVNGLFTGLIAASRATGASSRLVTWWSETRCAKVWGDIARPDAYARWRHGADEVEFFLEFDCGTEPLRTLAAKLLTYEKLAMATGIATPVLFWLPTLAREASARRALTATLAELERPDLVPVATSTHEVVPTLESHVGGACWLPIPTATAPNTSRPGERMELAALPTCWPLRPPSGAAGCDPGGVAVVGAPDPHPPWEGVAWHSRRPR
ncbi:replication-relaxation family protein [Crossiella sp. SN42]|uniref:replication-relaxation family protein n=1 Tax=Crossiella sp. SN42 TaxID=2944808 RepID=UPI00207CA6C5|nr:replication-relaxation family protein [Crossiella sp. SN42]MCO1575897.1 replication-relaxation family protein [Crossiella sp. SN42]